MANSFTAESPARASAPMLADASRDDGREPLRDVVRLRPREPHEKYYVDKNDPRLKGQDGIWVATKIRGAPNPRLGEFIRAGYRPARAVDWPEFSDFQLYDQTLIDMGVVPQVNADSPVIRDDQMLVVRSARMSEQAVKESNQRADRQLNDHIRRIRERSEREIGAARTRISRNYGPNDIVPDDEEGMESR